MGVCGQRQLHVHPIEAGNHGRDAENDRQRGQELDRFADIVGEDNLVGIAQAPDALDADRAQIF